jgi:hypothetical protein
MAVTPGSAHATQSQEKCTFHWRGEMKVLTGLALLIGLAACNTRSGDRETGRVTADTSVTPVQTQDTTIVRKETKVDTDVDTVHKKGDVNRDSAHQ